jgi:hypothetical protein
MSVSYARRHNTEWQRWYQQQRKRGFHDLRKEDFSRCSRPSMPMTLTTAILTKSTTRSATMMTMPTIVRRSDLADLIVESNPAVARSDAIHWLLNNSNGHALLLRTLKRRLTKQQKRKEGRSMPPHDRLTEIVKIAKDHGLESFCKGIADDTDIPAKFSEHEFTAAVSKIAKEQGTTFAAMFTKQDDVGISLRKAHAAINAVQQPMSYMKGVPVEKAAPQATLTPRVSGGRDAQDVDDPKDALAKLHELAAELREAKPHLSSAAAFALIYSDPQYSKLAEAERRQNRPRVA